MTIGTLAARIMADASGIKSGMGLARDELMITRQAFRDSATDADKLNTALAQLESARGKGAFANEEQYAAAVAAVRAELDPLVIAQQAAADATDAITAKLQEQIATFGLTAEEITRYKLEQQGATAEQVESVAALQRQIAAMNEAQAEYDQYQAEMKAVEATIEAAKVAEVERVQATIDAAERIKTALREEIATRGMSADEIEVWRLEEQGASQATIAGVTALQRQASALRDQDAATAAAAAESNRLEQEIEQLSQALRQEAATAGMSADQIQLWKLRHQGASDASVKMVAQLQAQRNAAIGAAGGHGKLAGGLQNVMGSAGGAIPGVSGLTNALQLGHPVLIGAAAAVAGIAIAYKTARAALDWYTQGVGEALTEIDKLSKESRTLGTSVQDLRELRFAFGEIAGLDTGQTDKALERLTRAIGEANAGGKEQQAVFKALKLDSQELARAGTAEAMRQLAGAIQAVESPTERMRIAIKIFGREGADVINVLSGGREALDASAEAVSRYAGVISDLDAAQIEAANDAWSRVSMALAGLTEQAAVKLAPALQVAAEKVLDILDPQTQTGQSIALALEVVPPLLAKIIDLADILIGKFQQQQIRVMEFANIAVQAAATIDQAIAYATPGYEASEDLKEWAANYQQQIDFAAQQAAERIESGLTGGTERRMQQLAKEAKKVFDEANKEVEDSGAETADAKLKAFEDAERQAREASARTAEEMKLDQEELRDEYGATGAAAGESLGEFTQEQQESMKFAEEFAKKREQANKTIEDTLAKAKEEAETYGMTAEEQQAYADAQEVARLQELGASEEQVAALKELQGELAEAKRRKEALRDTDLTIEAGSMASAFDAIRKASQEQPIVDRFAGIGEAIPATAEQIDRFAGIGDPIPVKTDEKQVGLLATVVNVLQQIAAKEGIVIEEVSL